MEDTSILHDDLFPGKIPFYKLDVRNMNEKFLQMICIIVEEQGKNILTKVIEDIKGAAQKYVKKTSLTIESHGLKNLWEDYCFQQQTEKSAYFVMQEEVISGLCYRELIDLKTKNIDHYNILTLYLSVSIFNFEERMIDDAEIEDFLLSEIKKAAIKYPVKEISFRKEIVIA